MRGSTALYACGNCITKMALRLTPKKTLRNSVIVYFFLSLFINAPCRVERNLQNCVRWSISRPTYPPLFFSALRYL